MHQHTSWEVILHISGEVKTKIEGIIYSVSPGDIMIIPPNTPHEEQSEIEYTDIYVQCYNLDFFGVEILHDHDGAVVTLMNLIHKVMIENEKENGLIADSLLQTICIYLKKYAELKSTSKFIISLKNEMYANLAVHDFSVTEAMKKIGFHIDHIRRCFKQETGVTPLEYLTNMRLNYAQELLLQETFISVADVAEKCGYHDSFYFSKIFKQKFGVSPLNYRKCHHNI